MNGKYKDHFTVLVLEHPIHRLVKLYDHYKRFINKVDPTKDTELWDIPIEKWFETEFQENRQHHNLYTKFLSTCKNWKCELTKDSFGEAARSINSFDVVIIQEWRRDPRIWFMLQNVFGIDSIQLRDNKDYEKQIGNDNDFPAKHGWKFGEIMTLHPLVEKWAEQYMYWDIQLYKYACKLVYTRISPMVNEEGFRVSNTYEEYLTRPEWNFMWGGQGTLWPWDNDINYFPKRAEQLPDFPGNYAKTTLVPFGDTRRDKETKP
eukprot:UN31551